MGIQAGGCWETRGEGACKKACKAQKGLAGSVPALRLPHRWGNRGPGHTQPAAWQSLRLKVFPNTTADSKLRLKTRSPPSFSTHEATAYTWAAVNVRRSAAARLHKRNHGNLCRRPRGRSGESRSVTTQQAGPASSGHQRLPGTAPAWLSRVGIPPHRPLSSVSLFFLTSFPRDHEEVKLPRFLVHAKVRLSVKQTPAKTEPDLEDLVSGLHRYFWHMEDTVTHTSVSLCACVGTPQDAALVTPSAQSRNPEATSLLSDVAVAFTRCELPP